MVPMLASLEGETIQRRIERLQRFRETPAAFDVVPEFNQEVPSKPIVGRSGKLFRPYVRLAAGPDPEVVRPEAILSASLSALLDADAQPSGGWQAIREQLWSIRQDLQMQHLHSSSLAVRVALEGARLSVEFGDVAEMHRCLAPLVGHGHCVQLLRAGPIAEEDEVAALRLLYLAHGGADAQPGSLQAELSEFMQDNRHLMQPQPRGTRGRIGPGMEFAGKVRSALSSARWPLYWRLISNAGGEDSHPSSQRDCSMDGVPDSVRKLARLLSGPVRRHALEGFAKAFKPGMSASTCATLLGVGDVRKLIEWLKEELQLEKLGPSGQPLGKDGRLDCSAVCDYIKKADDLKKAMLEARNSGGRRPLSSSSSAVLGKASAPPGEAQIWSELQPQLLPFVARDAALKKMEEKKAQKVLAKKLKKAKKDAKKEKKAKKKAKKARRKEEKRREGGQLKRKERENDDEGGRCAANPHERVSISSSSSSSSS
mmetsp:Transcript_54534/g.100929  ORF Transcript_54534/g.100929 Transcript_54534/m.100929 type:complete len:484 (+) Transcript_54534:62-1513(+)